MLGAAEAPKREGGRRGAGGTNQKAEGPQHFTLDKIKVSEGPSHGQCFITLGSMTPVDDTCCPRALSPCSCQARAEVLQPSQRACCTLRTVFLLLLHRS